MTSHVLVVDDDPDVLEAVRLALTTEDDRDLVVATALSGQEALRLLEAQDFRLVLADFRMPGMDGVELLERVRSLRPETVRGLFTGFHDLEIALAAVDRASVHYYLQKPWDNAELRAVVREALKKA